MTEEEMAIWYAHQLELMAQGKLNDEKEERLKALCDKELLAYKTTLTTLGFREALTEGRDDDVIQHISQLKKGASEGLLNTYQKQTLRQIDTEMTNF